MNPNELQGTAVEAKLSGAAQNAVCAQASRFAFTTTLFNTFSLVLAHIELLSLFSIPQLRKFEAYYEALTMREDSNNVAFLF